TGLRSLRLSPSNFVQDLSASNGEAVALHESTIASESIDFEAVALEALLKEGVALDARWERRAAAFAEVVMAGGVAVVLTTDITEEVASGALALNPAVVVFLEDGFAGRDAVKANTFTNARQ